MSNLCIKLIIEESWAVVPVHEDAKAKGVDNTDARFWISGRYIAEGSPSSYNARRATVQKSSRQLRAECIQRGG
jgi:hypothetical protein